MTEKMPVKNKVAPLSICHTLAGMYMIPMQARTVASKSLKAGPATSRIFFRLSASDPTDFGRSASSIFMRGRTQAAAKLVPSRSTAMTSDIAKSMLKVPNHGLWKTSGVPSRPMLVKPNWTFVAKVFTVPVSSIPAT